MIRALLDRAAQAAELALGGFEASQADLSLASHRLGEGTGLRAWPDASVFGSLAQGRAAYGAFCVGRGLDLPKAANSTREIARMDAGFGVDAMGGSNRAFMAGQEQRSGKH
jgi:hypothetical protein